MWLASLRSRGVGFGAQMPTVVGWTQTAYKMSDPAGLELSAHNASKACSLPHLHLCYLCRHGHSTFFLLSDKAGDILLHLMVLTILGPCEGRSLGGAAERIVALLPPLAHILLIHDYEVALCLEVWRSLCLQNYLPLKSRCVVAPLGGRHCSANAGASRVHAAP